MKVPPTVPTRRRISSGMRARSWPSPTVRGGRKPTESTPNHFKKLLEGPCPNHAFPIKHLYKDCGIMKHFLFGGSNKGEHRGDPKPAIDDAEGKDGGFPTLDGCLIIFGGSAAYDSKCC